MPDLEKRIAEWRKRMAAGGVKTPAVLDELESHLREEIEQQMRVGANEERALANATQKIGPADALKAEFRKNRYTSSLEKIMVGIAVLVVAFGVFLTSVTMVLCYSSWGERLIGFAAAFGFIAMMIFGWSRIVPHVPVIPNKPKRLAIEYACFFGGFGICVLYAQLVERPDQMIPAIDFLGLIPFAVGCVLAKAIQEAERRSRTQIKA